MPGASSLEPCVSFSGRRDEGFVGRGMACGEGHRNEKALSQKCSEGEFDRKVEW